MQDIDSKLYNFHKFGEYKSEKERQKFQDSWLDAVFFCPVQKEIFLEMTKDCKISFEIKEVPTGSFPQIISTTPNGSRHYHSRRNGRFSTSSGSFLSETLMILCGIQSQLPSEFYPCAIEAYRQFTNNGNFVNQFFLNLKEEFEGSYIVASGSSIFTYAKGKVVFNRCLELDCQIASDIVSLEALDYGRFLLSNIKNEYQNSCDCRIYKDYLLHNFGEGLSDFTKFIFCIEDEIHCKKVLDAIMTAVSGDLLNIEEICNN